MWDAGGLKDLTSLAAIAIPLQIYTYQLFTMAQYTKELAPGSLKDKVIVLTGSPRPLHYSQNNTKSTRRRKRHRSKPGRVCHPERRICMLRRPRSRGRRGSRRDNKQKLATPDHLRQDRRDKLRLRPGPLRQSNRGIRPHRPRCRRRRYLGDRERIRSFLGYAIYSEATHYKSPRRKPNRVSVRCTHRERLSPPEPASRYRPLYYSRLLYSRFQRVTGALRLPGLETRCNRSHALVASIPLCTSTRDQN